MGENEIVAGFVFLVEGAGSHFAGSVSLGRNHPRFVDGDPLPHAVAKERKSNVRILRERICLDWYSMYINIRIPFRQSLPKFCLRLMGFG